MKDVKYNCLKNRSKVKKWQNYRRFDVIFFFKKVILKFLLKSNHIFFTVIQVAFRSTKLTASRWNHFYVG
jgi:hypothetical protein